MKNELLKLTSAILAASFLAVGSSAIAADKDSGQQTPVDCKEKPQDPACKGKEEGKGK
ncbi:MAG TPA: hypothetical protein VK043_03555 [Burkholderiales bacterium]|nr:hypothetical protein [Burkholderiales bacterium]